MSGFVYVADQAADESVWKTARAGKITATDVGKIMTSGPGGWAELKRSKAHGSSFRGNRYTEWGHEREPVILEWLSIHHGLVPNSWLLAREDLPGHAATPDAISEQGTLLGEVKTTVKDWPTVEDIPRAYWWQMQWQMYVTEARRTVFAFELHEDFVPVWMEPRVFLVDRDDVRIEEALARVAEWVEFDETGVDAPHGLDELLAERRLLKEVAEAAAARVTAKDAELRDLIDTAEWTGTFEGTGARISYSGKPIRTDRFDQTAFKKASPDTYKQFIKTTESQPRLTITARS